MPPMFTACTLWGIAPESGEQALMLWACEERDTLGFLKCLAVILLWSWDTSPGFCLGGEFPHRLENSSWLEMVDQYPSPCHICPHLSWSPRRSFLIAFNMDRLRIFPMFDVCFLFDEQFCLQVISLLHLTVNIQENLYSFNTLTLLGNFLSHLVSSLTCFPSIDLKGTSTAQPSASPLVTRVAFLQFPKTRLILVRRYQRALTVHNIPSRRLRCPVL